MTSPQNQNVPPPIGFRQWINVFTGLATFPTLTILPYARALVGFDQLHPGVIVAMTALLLMLQSVENFHVALPLVGRMGAAHLSEGLRDFAFVFFFWALWERRKRWKELLRGEGVHTYSRGVSRLEFLPIRQDIIYRIVDPICVWLCGALLRKIGIGGLGLWIEFSAFCFYLVENYAYDRALEHDLSLFNIGLESKVAAETAAFFEGQGGGAVKARSLRETKGIQTGVDAELEAIITRRKKETEGQS